MQKDTTYYIGKKVNYLTLLNYNKKGSKWKCQCDCGEICYVVTANFKRGKGRSCMKCKSKCLSESLTKLPTDLMLKRSIYRRYKSNAQITNKQFTLTEECFFNLLKEKCFYCQIQPEKHVLKIHKKPYELYHNGIDRKDNTLGYIENNCVPCCHLCNISKNNHSLNDWKNWINRISQNKDNF